MIEAMSSKKVGGTGVGLGPGPQTTDKYFKRADGGESGYFGLVAGSLMPSTDQLRSVYPLGGSVWNSSSNWMKFLLDGKILFITTSFLMVSTPRSDFYKRGICYGRDDTGGYPDGTPVNQNQVFTFGNYNFRVRLPRVSLKDTYAAADMAASEWARLIWTVDKSTQATDTEAGVKWDSLDLGIPGKHCMTAQVLQATPGNAVCIGYENVKTPSSLGRTQANVNVGWRPVLELIP